MKDGPRVPYSKCVMDAAQVLLQDARPPVLGKNTGTSSCEFRAFTLGVRRFKLISSGVQPPSRVLLDQQ